MYSNSIHCSCGKVHLQLSGAPLASVECCCNSCRAAAERMQALPGSPKILTDYGATPLVLYRKDRVQILAGAAELAGFRLSAASPTRRIVATCCNTPIFLDFERGHWLSLFGALWPTGSRPPLEMRSMTGDLADSAGLPNDVPNSKKFSLGFFLRLMRAWVGMGFRVPKMAVPRDL